MYFELKVRGQNKRGWFEVTLTHSPPPPPNSPRFIIANFCTRSRVHRMVYNLAHHVAPAAFRLYFIVSNKLVASCTYIYIYIFALCHEFPTYSSKVFYDMLVGITWLPGKLRSFERATLNSGNTAEQFSSAIDDLLPLPYFSKIFRIYRGENVQHAPSLSFSLPTTFLFLQPLEFDRQRRSGKTISFLPEGRFFFPLISFFFLIYFYKVILDKRGGWFN